MIVELYDHPFAAVAPQVFQVESLGEWLLQQYGDAPAVRVQVFAGEPSAATEITGDVAAIMSDSVERYVVLQSPGGPFWAAYGIYVLFAVALVAAFVLIPKPVMPGNVNRTQQSPNNALANRENQVRMYERIEDIYGTVLSIPSLLMPTYNKYIGNRKFEYGFYCVGRGYHDLDELRDGDTLIEEITGASVAVYAPFTSPNSGDAPALLVGDAIIDRVLTTSRAIEVDGVALRALNQVQLPPTGIYTFTPGVAGGVITQKDKNPNFNAVTEIGDTISVVSAAGYTVMNTPLPGGQAVNAAGNAFTGTGGFEFTDMRVGDVVTIGGFAVAGNNGVRTVTGKPTAYIIAVSGAALANETASAATFSVTRNYSGDYLIEEVDDGSVRVAPADSSYWTSTLPLHTCSIQIADVSEYTDWVTLPAADRHEVWCNIVAPNGMYRDDGGRALASVTFAIEIEQLSLTLAPTGVVEIVAGSLSGAVTDERADTIEHATAWTGPARVRMRRTSSYDYLFKGTIIDEIKWSDLYSVAPVDREDFGNMTTIHTVTQATARATAVKSRQLNCLAARRLPLYNGVSFSGTFDASGRHANGTIAATSRLVDIIAAVTVDPLIGGRPLAEIDLAQIWGVQQQLDAWRPDVGQFNYTFDSDNTSFEETLVAIANAGFCIAYRQNGKVRLAFDRAQPASTALFTHRNKKPNSESITRRFANDADFDGIEFTYVDPDSQQSETITLPLDGGYTKLKKFEIPGIRSFAQAWLRANREYQKILGQRISIDTTALLDARSLLPNARIDIVDNTRFKSYDGEIVGQAGLELTLSQDVVFTPGQPHSLVLIRRDGTLQSIPVVAGSEPNRVMLQQLPSEAVVTSFGEAGIRTIYSFAADSARGAMAYLVQEIDVSDGQYVPIKAINYSDAYYTMDHQLIPDRDSIIS